MISAHNVNPIPGAPSPKEYPLPDVDRPYVDLFSAQTGMILSLTAHLLGGQLDGVTPMLRRRIEREVRGRILSPFMETDDFWWMGVRRKDLCNWTPWILSNIMVCAALSPMTDGELARLLTRACGMLDRYLDTLPADGGCDEGTGYWNMAGGALMDCLTLLEKLTGGWMTFWQDEKVRNILTFPLKMNLGNGWFVNFADCDARPFLSGERLETAGRRLRDPSLRALGTAYRGTLADQLNDVPHFTRVLDLLFSRPEETPAEPAGAAGDVYLPDLQVRVLKKGPFVLACKGGHNGESHNHNDVGSLILTVNGEPAVVDAGNMVYTAKTFSLERYTLWNVRAAYHNLPLIGDMEQREGRAHAARQVHCTGDGLSLSLADTYGAEAGIETLDRAFVLTEERLTVTDTILLKDPLPVTWVWMLRQKPSWTDGTVTAGQLRIRCAKDLSFRAEEIPVTDERMKRNWPGSLWRVTLRSRPETCFRETFEFQMKE